MAARYAPRTRAKDSDRSNTCQLLDSALADGQLTLEEHRDRVAAATRAATLGELQDLVADLQRSKAPANLRPRRRMPRLSGPAWVLVAAAATGLLAVVVAIVVVLFSGGDDSDVTSDSEPTASPTAEIPVAPLKPAEPNEVAPSVLMPPTQLHTVEGMTGLLDQMRKRFGDTTGIELAITPDAAMLFRPDPADDQSKLLYRFNGGWGDPTRRPRDDKDNPADLGAFDVQAVAEVLRTAPETLRIAPADVSEVFVDVDHIADPSGPGALELLVKVEAKSGGDGFIYLDSAGNTKRVEYPS
jgi:Domain of unknown function (DUF1707)